MAKKKQFAGKKTKLAELPLTRALKQRAEDEAAWEELQTSGATGSRQLLLSLERTGEEAVGSLAAAYFQVVRELAGLQADLEPDAAPSLPPDLQLPPVLPPPKNLIQALRVAREGLQDLHRLLSE
jgi:hypothetical protein